MNNLPDVLLENIFERLSLEDILTCACVCSQWNQIINQDIFWKRLLYKHFDIQPSEERLKSSMMVMWRGDKWFPCFWGEVTCCYVFKPFPFVLGCGVVTPYGFKFDSSYKNVVIALEKLKILSLRYTLLICLLYTSPSPRDS